jgi:uncharacterized membrane protein YhaH (DUF805 family)
MFDLTLSFVLGALFVIYGDKPLHQITLLEFASVSLGIFLVNIPLVVPRLAVSVRRLHDFDINGWWYLMCYLPFSTIVWFALMCGRGTNGENSYGQPLITWVEQDPPPPERRIEHRKFGVYYYTYEQIEES